MNKLTYKVCTSKLVSIQNNWDIVLASMWLLKYRHLISLITFSVN